MLTERLRGACLCCPAPSSSPHSDLTLQRGPLAPLLPRRNRLRALKNSFPEPGPPAAEDLTRGLRTEGASDVTEPLPLDRPHVSRGWDSGLSWPQRIHPDPRLAGDQAGGLVTTTSLDGLKMGSCQEAPHVCQGACHEAAPGEPRGVHTRG